MRVLPAVLCVDDEPLVLEGLTNTLRKEFSLTCATSGASALEMVQEKGPFVVVVSDMRMPIMDGAALLAQMRERTPDTIRMLLTGHSDIEAAISAVNEGQIFRFLTKPCPPPVLSKALHAAVRQHELIVAERVLLEQTLRGSIQMLTDLLAMCSPRAFGRAERIRQRAALLAARQSPGPHWQLEVAAMLSQVGCLTLPDDTVERLLKGLPLAADERPMVAHIPAVAEGLLAKIPRMEVVREMLAGMEHGFESGPHAGTVAEKGSGLWGARLLRLVTDFVALEDRETPPLEALETLTGRMGSYAPDLLALLAQVVGQEDATAHIQELYVRDLRAGMVLVDNVTATNGTLLMARGQPITPGFLERITNFARRSGLKEPIRVRC